ncbi:MAG: hypothetical protein MJK15_00655 [Colwellia sp.]|nr:hypothetical protein [Colwellia sp.]
MAQPEDKTKKAVKAALLELSPIVYQFMPSAAFGGRKGVPDHIACLPVVITQEMVGQTFGAFIGVESKTLAKNSKLHGLQPLNLAQITAAGGFAQVVYSKAGAEIMKQQLVERYKLCQVQK